MSVRSIAAGPAGRAAAALALLAGAAVALSLGVYAKVHHPAQRPLFLIGFSGMLQLKTWLTTAALLLVLVQLLSALWMWGRLPGAGSPPARLPAVHRWSGAVAFLVTVPVALHCVWALGLLTTSPRVLAHGVLGCLFYGAYAAKMLGLRLRGLPGWVLPAVGGAVFALFVLLWATSALWFFTRSGVPSCDRGAPVAIPLLTRRSVLSGAVVTVVGGIAGYLTVRASGAAGGSGGTTGSSAYGAPAGGQPKPLLALSRLPAGGTVVLSGARIVLTRSSGGQVQAFSAVCTHQGCTVGLSGGVLQCPCHGSRFAANTGAVTQGPAARPLPPVRVVVRNGEVYRS